MSKRLQRRCVERKPPPRFSFPPKNQNLQTLNDKPQHPALFLIPLTSLIPPLPMSFSLEQKLTELRTLVEKMNQGVSDFDKQVELFQQGTKLIEECREYLDQSEMKIQQLIDGKMKNGALES